MAQQQDERISYFTSLCEQLYNPKSPGHNVQTILEASFPIFSGPSSAVVDHGYSFGIHSPTDTANALKIMLENSPNPYVQMFCFSRLKQLVSTQFTIFDQETKLQLRKRITYRLV
jgi:exportin-7